jgi:GT2 family glycosyltransferase
MPTAVSFEPDVSVIIPTYRRFEPVLETVSDLLVQDYPRFEILVADQNRQWPGTLEERRTALRRDPRVRWMNLDQPGVVRARNQAVAEARGDVLLFVDDDVFIPSRQLIAAHARHFQDPAVVAVIGRERQLSDGAIPDDPVPPLDGAAVLPPPASLTPLQQALWFNRNGTAPQHVCTFSTCNGSLRRTAFLAIGGFDEGFRGNSYGDDYDLALRLHQAGGVMVYDPYAWVIHRRVPFGGLRLSDAANTANGTDTIEGFWRFIFRHGYPGMYAYLVRTHVLRKTVLLRRNLMRPWRQPMIMLQTARACWRAWRRAGAPPQSRFTLPSAMDPR